MRTVQSLALLAAAGCCVLSHTASAFLQPAAPAGRCVRWVCVCVSPTGVLAD